MSTLTPREALHTAGNLRILAAPVDQATDIIRWQQAIDKAAQADSKNPALADIMDLALLCVEDVTDPAAKVTRAEIEIHGKTFARFNFPIIQMAIATKIALTWGPDGPAGRDDITGEDMRNVALSIFRRFHQEHVLKMTVDEYEAKLTGDGMIPEKAQELSRLIVSTLAGDCKNATIDRTQPLNQHLKRRRAS